MLDKTKSLASQEKYLYKKINISMVRVSFWKKKTEDYKNELKELKKKKEQENINKALVIIKIIKERYLLNNDYNLSQSLKQKDLDPIYKAVKLIDNNINLKYRIIGSLFNRDRSTINYILRTIDDIIETDKIFRTEYESILNEHNLKYKKYKPRK